MRVIYLFNIDGWALEDIGLGLRAALQGEGIDLVPMRIDRWRQQPQSADVLYLSWSGMVKLPEDLHRHAPRVVTTIHDPQEVSHFENRADWLAWPMRRLHWLAAVDGISVISDELREVMRRHYHREVIRTPTWPSRYEALRTAQDHSDRSVVKAIASTNLPPRHGWRQRIGRLRDWSSYLVDSDGRPSLRQLAGLAVGTRRKNIPALRRLARATAGRDDLTCEFHWGGPHFANRDDYQRWLAGSDVYVCASTMEGGPLPVMEAVLAGLAVVSTPVGQVADWVEDGRNGFIVEDEAAMRRALGHYARNRELLRRHRAASREIAASFKPPISGWITFLRDGG